MSAPFGLRRINSDRMVASEAGETMTVTPEQEELVSIAEDIQGELLMIIEKFLHVTNLMDGQVSAARQQQAFYEDHIWPAVIDANNQIDWLANAVREGIDSCTITENRLNVLLAINKFRVHIQDIVTYLTNEAHIEIEEVLELRQRGICGISLRANTIDILRKYQNNLRLKILKV